MNAIENGAVSGVDSRQRSLFIDHQPNAARAKGDAALVGGRTYRKNRRHRIGREIDFRVRRFGSAQRCGAQCQRGKEPDEFEIAHSTSMD
jgi:hypothetical protein